MFDIRRLNPRQPQVAARFQSNIGLNVYQKPILFDVATRGIMPSGPCYGPFGIGNSPLLRGPVRRLLKGIYASDAVYMKWTTKKEEHGLVRGFNIRLSP